MKAIARIVPPSLALGFVLVPALAGASTTRPLVALTASPAHVSLVGVDRTAVRVANSGRSPVVVDVVKAGFALDLRGRPRIVRRSRSGRSWVGVRPRRLALTAGGTASLTIASRPPHGAEPGDHPELVLLTTRPRRNAGVAVRMRLGLVVEVRAPGKIARSLVLRRVHVRTSGRVRTLELLVVNRGNVTETLTRDAIDLTLRRRGRALVRLHAEPRELLPRTRGLVEFRYRGRIRGRVSALARIWYEPGGRMVFRAYTVRL